MLSIAELVGTLRICSSPEVIAERGPRCLRGEGDGPLGRYINTLP
jgi:hypothetical protein